MATRLISIKILLLSLVIGKINLELKFKKRLTELFDNSENISNKKLRCQTVRSFARVSAAVFPVGFKKWSTLHW